MSIISPAGPATALPSLAPAMALVQLLQEHPELPAAQWTVDDRLRGHMYGPHVGNFDALHAYAELLGGSIRATYEYEACGTRLRSHDLTTTWRDVKVVVSVSVPLRLSDEHEAALAEQRHQFFDLDPDLAWRWAGVDFGVTA